MAKKNEAPTESGIDVGETLGRAELFVEKNKKALAIIIGAVVIIVGGFFAYKYLYAAPRETQAGAEAFQADYYFERDSFKLALEGDTMSKGYLAIIDEYDGTDVANRAKHAAGICYLRLGKYDDALTQLESYSNTGDLFVDAQNIGLIGDAYMEKGDVDQAIDNYKKAAEKSTNNFTTPHYLFKAAGAYEDQKKYKEAFDLYERIKNEYYTSAEGQEVEKHISRVKVLGNIQ